MRKITIMVSAAHLQEVSFYSITGDFRIACIFNDVQGLKINQMKIDTPFPNVVLRKIKGSKLTDLD